MQRIALGLFALAFFAAPSGVSGEIFMLENGGRVEGDILNPKESPRKRFVIKTTTGAQMTIDKDQVKEVIHRTANDIEYDKVRSRYPDTIEGQWGLAEWCRERNLATLRARHLERIIEIDPDHEKARQALHYRRVGGEWKTQKQEMEEQGYVSFKGKWRTTQEVTILQRKRTVELAVKEWKKRLKKWRDWLENGREAEATQQIDAIDDPYAVTALADALKRESVDDYRKRYINALGRIGGPSAWHVLCVLALEDENDDVRLTCLDHLEGNSSEAFVEYFIGRLNDTDNHIVNRAALALGRMKSPSAISPLIDHLITRHKRMIAPPTGGMGGTFGSGPGISGGGLSAGSSPAVVVNEPHQNPEVLNTLLRMSDGVNFDYDVPAWKQWYASRKKAQSLNGRRDDD